MGGTVLTGLGEGLFHGLSHHVGSKRLPSEGRGLSLHLELRELGVLQIFPGLSDETAAVSNEFPGGL